MLKTTTVVVGAGHSGLAMSRCLADRSIDHVILERGEVAHSWRTQRWDSLRLLTPNWMTRLPGYAYRGDDPAGYLAATDVVELIADYAKETAAPVRANTTVTSVRQTERGYVVQTDQDCWQARSVVLAAGASTVAKVPALQAGVPAGITTLTPAVYRNPGQLPDGGVLVVGASASGIQIAEELHRSGRPVTLAVGEHVRMPRTYRGEDILWWMDAAGLLAERYDQIPDLVRARHLPSMQLVGSADRRTLDLNSLSAARRAAGRTAGRHPGRNRPVLRLVGQHVRPGRPQARTAARHHRCVGDPSGLGQRTAATVRTHRRSRRHATDPRPPIRRNPHDSVGHRIPTRSVLARRPGVRPQRRHPPRRRRDRQPRACT